MFVPNRIVLLPLMFAVVGYGCQKTQPQASTANDTAAPPVAPTPPPAAPPAPAAPAANEQPLKVPEHWARGPSPDPVGFPKEGWSKVTADDNLPLCVFSDFAQRDAAQFIEQVRPQTLPAKSRVVFGAFGPSCINPDCDALPTLQCNVQLDGHALTVKAHYWAYHKAGARCSKDCAEVTASCASPELEAGTYTVHYGDKTFSLKVPSKLAAPCFVK